MLRLEGMAEVFDQASRVAPRRMPVLVQGETGVGKESVAHHLHRESGRRGPFIAFNCGAVTESLVTSTLFGHKKGAFSGAITDEQGVIRAAHGGTLFLDEIGELPLSVQPTLLRVLDTSRVMPVGSTHEYGVDFRLIAATHRDLLSMCESGKFREDLLHRISGFEVSIPPLRERRGDIVPLVDYFLHGLFHSYGSYEISEEALGLIVAHDWPGNVRELRNTVEAAAALAGGGKIEAKHVRFWSRASAKSPRKPRTAEETKVEPYWIREGLNAHLEAVEAQAIKDALRRTGGKQREAARLLKIPLRTLAYKLSRIRTATRPAEAQRVVRGLSSEKDAREVAEAASDK